MSTETKEKKQKPKELATGSVPYSEIKDSVHVPERGIYQWEEIVETLKGGNAYVLPSSAKKNSILTGIRREKIDGRIAEHKLTKQLVIVPNKPSQ